MKERPPLRNMANEYAAALAETPHFGVQVQHDIPYADHGETLLADLYQPDGPGPFPAVVLIHGGGGAIGDRSLYANWGEWLAERGFVCFAASYRLASSQRATWRESVIDCVYSVKYLRGRAKELKVDPDRIGVMGGSAGGRLAALTALAWRHPAFASPHTSDPYAGVSPQVKAVIPFYGASDAIAQWEHSVTIRPPGGNPHEKWMGGSVVDAGAREAYYLMTPAYHATRTNGRGTAWLVVYGTVDELVPPGLSEVFLRHLRRTGAITHNQPVVGAPHGFLWQSDVEEPGTHNATIAPRVLWFLKTYLRGSPSANLSDRAG